MRVREITTRNAPASIRELIARWGRAPERAAIPVHRRELPYWQEHGWTVRGSVYTGSYQTRYAAFYGQITIHRGGHIDFLLYNPSPEIRGHSHWTCFQHRGSDWYLVHMARQPRDVSSGIITIERLITEAYEQ